MHIVTILNCYINFIIPYIGIYIEKSIDGVQDLRYYVESDGKKYYMMVQPLTPSVDSGLWCNKIVIYFVLMNWFLTIFNFIMFI